MYRVPIDKPEKRTYTLSMERKDLCFSLAFGGPAAPGAEARCRPNDGVLGFPIPLIFGHVAEDLNSLAGPDGKNDRRRRQGHQDEDY